MMDLAARFDLVEIALPMYRVASAIWQLQVKRAQERERERERERRGESRTDPGLNFETKDTKREPRSRVSTFRWFNR